jgi:2-polyprenyl-3-methyl-5-hydroxy-6-metoxy-1,4-benzoquinol methylase
MIEDMINRNYNKKKPASSILDIGCGYGTLLSYASEVYGANGTCLDVTPYLKSSIMEKYSLSFITGNIEKDPLPAGKRYDIIIMTEVLEHLNFQPVPTLKKIYDSLQEDGVFFISTPDADSGWGRTFQYYNSLKDIPLVDPDAPWIDGHIWQYKKSELIKILKAAGFKIHRLDRSEGLTGLHFNIWAVKDKKIK